MRPATGLDLGPSARELTPQEDPPSRSYPFAAFCVAALALLAAALPGAAAFLIDRSDTGTALEPWRTVTGNIVHASTAHLAGNLLFFLPLATLRESRAGRARFLGELLVLACAVALSVRLLHPDWTTYCGLSGIIYGLISLILFEEIERPRSRRARLVAGVILGAVVLKTALEVRYGGWMWGAAGMEEALGVQYLPGSHVGGLVGGALVAFLGGGAQGRPLAASGAATAEGPPPPPSL